MSSQNGPCQPKGQITHLLAKWSHSILVMDEEQPTQETAGK